MIVLLVVKPGPLRDGLDALLYTIPEVQLVAHANDTNAAFEFCQQHPIELIILEIRPGDRGPLAKIPGMKSLCPQGQVVALIHDEEDREPAEASGVDLVLTSGLRAAKLREVITEITGLLIKEKNIGMKAN
jgi:DNA-binding NarL/FixJ family response regulator